MTDTLIGVVVGGLIAWVAPLMTLRYSERRWRFETLLKELKAERDNFQVLYERNLGRLADGMSENSYSSNMTSDIFVLMPKEIADMFAEHMAEKDKTEFHYKETYLKIASAMKRDLKSRDERIRALLAT